MKWTLQSLSTTSGYLQSCPIEFSPGLNCIIGARGTCKSTIVETIRFAFGCEPEKLGPMINREADLRAPRAGLLQETLGGGTAKCVIGVPEDPAESSYVVERNAPGASRVYRDGVQLVDDTAVLHKIEIFSQGDLLTIAEQPERRLALIDRPNQRQVTDLKSRLEAITGELRAIGPVIRQHRSEIESRQARIQTLEQARKQLSDLQANRPSLSPELEAERIAYNDRRQTLERLKSASQSYSRAMDACRAVLAEEISIREASEFAASLGTTGADRIATVLAEFADVTPAIRRATERPETLAEAIVTLSEEYETLNAKYYDLRKDQQAVNEALKSEETLRQNIVAMERVEAELVELNGKYASDLARRRDLRSQREAVADELYSMRMVQIERINQDFHQQIVLTLQPGVLTTKHRKMIEALLQRSNLRSQSEVARDLAEKVKPSDLIDIVEASDASRLAEALNRDIGQMTRLVSHLVDNAGLYELETIVPEDNLEITMVVRGVARPIAQLSKGQMATALLPLILREADYPLIVDQPEDDLDNAFVSDSLIKQLKTLGRKRQLIFVTHNANIPVLGNADTVIVMEMDGPRKAEPCRRGSVDEMKEPIIQLLEGGKEAFNSRHIKYGTALS